MKFLKRSVLVTVLLGILLLLTSCEGNKTVNTGESGAGQTGEDSWVVSQEVEFVKQYNDDWAYVGDYDHSNNEYRFTVTVKKDKPSDRVKVVWAYTDADGDWRYDNETWVSSSDDLGRQMRPLEANSDGTFTYQASDQVFTSNKDEFGNPYDKRFRYEFGLMNESGEVK